VRLMCGVTLKERVASKKFRARLGIVAVTELVTVGGLRWLGHVEPKDGEEWVSPCRYLKVEGSKGRGRGRKTWREGENGG
jgi:hypothetical protein